MRKNTLMILCTLAVACAAGLAWISYGGHASSNHARRTRATDLRNDSDRNLQLSDPPSASAISRAAGPSTPRERFEQSRDLFALVQGLRAAADGGDAAAQTLIADAYLECIGVALDPAYRNPGVAPAEEGHPQLKRYVGSLLAIHRERCGRLESQDVGGLQAIRTLYANAAKNGSSKALAMQLMYNPDLDAVPDAELAADVEQIKNSGDPDAIGALSNLMGSRAESRDVVFGTPSGTEMDEYAWLLAACEMGMECGPDSAVVRGYCLNGGICDANSVDRIIASDKLSASDYRMTLALSRQIVSNIEGQH